MTKDEFAKDLSDFMKLIDFEEEASKFFLDLLDKVWENEECRGMLLFHVEKYRDTGEIEFGKVINDAVVTARDMKLPQYGCLMLFFIGTAMYSYPVYEKRGLSREVWIDSMSDFRYKLNECKKLHGEWGTFVFWFGRFYDATLIALGRLEFELINADSDFKQGEFDIKEGDPLINVHIPSNERVPLSKEECDKAYDMAQKHFADYFEGGHVIFTCDSWLLWDEMKKFLPEDSNILRFASEYTIDRERETTGDLWRVFYMENCEAHPEDLPESNSMMKGFKKLLLEGIKPRQSRGYRKHKKK